MGDIRTGDPMSEITFGADGHTLLIGNTLWDLATRTEWARLRGPGDRAGRPAWHPDGTAVATAGAHGTVTPWQLDEHRAVARVCADVGRLGSPGVEPLPQLCPPTG